jgi:hypothetical protein
MEIRTDYPIDFEIFRNTLLRKGTPPFVPLGELHITNSRIMKRLVGNFSGSVHELTEEYIVKSIEFTQKIGYSYVHVPVHVLARAAVCTDEFKEFLPIRTSEDVDRFPWERVKGDFSGLEWARKHIPPKMKIISGDAMDGIVSVAWFLLDPPQPTTLYKAMGSPSGYQMITNLVEKIARVENKIYEKIVTFEDVGAIWTADDVSEGREGLAFPLGFLREHFIPYLAEKVKIAKTRDLPVIFHSDGNIESILPDFKRIGIDAIHPIQPEAMEPSYVKKKYGDDFCFVGAIDLTTLILGTRNEVRQLVAKRIRELGPEGYILGSSNTISPEVPWENYKAMVETAFEIAGPKRR